MARTVWAYDELEELAGQTGFVVLEDGLADHLEASGAVQPTDGSELYKHIGSAKAPHRKAYATREIKAQDGPQATLGPRYAAPDAKAPKEGAKAPTGPQAAPNEAPSEPPNDPPRRGRPPKDK